MSIMNINSIVRKRIKFNIEPKSKWDQSFFVVIIDFSVLKKMIRYSLPDTFIKSLLEAITMSKNFSYTFRNYHG